MSVEELATLHRRYVELSDRFRAIWAFHQFLASLRKILFDGEQPQYPVDFQQVYSELKEVSQHLTATGGDMVRDLLEQVERKLEQLVWALVAEDSRVDPSSLRQFFLRVRNTDGKILTQLVKFYLYSYQGAGWAAERLDKVDFLLTRIAGDGRGAEGVVPGAREGLRELLRGLWGLLGSQQPAEATVADRCRDIEGVRTELAQVLDLDDLNRRRLVPRYREIKHCLGALFFQPDVLAAILETNLRLRQRIQDLYHQEEERIFSDYHRIFELEKSVHADGELSSELAEFRREIERFERHLERDEPSLEDLAQIRERVRSLLPRLAGAERVVAAAEAPQVEEEPVRPQAPPPLEGTLAEPYGRIVEALEGSNPEASPRAVALKPEIFPLRLEPREVVAYRRLASGGGRPEVERFLLEAAALRLRLLEDAAEIQAILDDTGTTGEAPIFTRARRTTALGDEVVRRFDHLLEQAVVAGSLEEAQDLQYLRMRLLRDHAALWLMAYRPSRRG